MALRVLYIAGSCAATLATDFNHPLKLRLSLVSLSAGFHTRSFNVTQASGCQVFCRAERGVTFQTEDFSFSVSVS